MLMRRPYLLLCVLLLQALTAGAAEVVRVAGTGSGSILMQYLASDYEQAHPGRRVDVLLPPLGSAGAARALDAGRIDIAITGRALKPEEKGLSARLYARTPLVFASSGNLQPQGFDQAALADLYAGRLRQWRDGTPIRLVLRSPFESDTMALHALGSGMVAAVDSALQRNAGPVAENDIDAVSLLTKLPGSFGTTTLGMIRMQAAPLLALPVAGVPPSMATLANGQYPLFKPLYLVTRPPMTAEAAAFVAWLESPPAAAILRRFEHLPEFR